MNSRNHDNDPSEYDDGNRYDDNTYDGNEHDGGGRYDESTRHNMRDDDTEVVRTNEDDDETHDRNGEYYEEDNEENRGRNGDSDEEYNGENDGEYEDNRRDKDNDNEESDEEEEDEYDDEYDEEAYREEDYEEKEAEEEDDRAKCLYATLCCCCVVLIIAAIITGIILAKKKKPKRGVALTSAPTSITVPPFVESDPNGDTTIYRSGPLQSEPQGDQNVLMVQNDTFILMNWYWDELGYPWFDEDDLADYDANGLLCLQHIPNTNESASGSTTYSICRLPSSFPGEELETSTSEGHNYSMPTDCMGEEKIDFDVKPDDETVCADVSPLINAHPPFTPTQPTETSPSMRRGLQENNFQNMLFMLDNQSTDKPASDEFYSKNSGDRSPTLKMTMTPKSNGGNNGNENGGSSEPGGSSGPGGNINSGPTSAPTLSSAPSMSARPSISAAPSSEPSISSAPTITPEPTTNYEPCGVCGNGPAGVPLRDDYPVTIPPDLAPPSVQGNATCAQLEEICLAGECNPMVCEGLVDVRDACGCLPETEDPTSCGICPAQTVISKPDENILDVLASYVPEETLDAAGDNVTCSDVEKLCKDGLCGADVCSSIPEIVREPCGCIPSGGDSPSAPNPQNNGPTALPTISAAPSSSPAPSYKAEFTGCGICGVGPTPNKLTDVLIDVPEHLAPPQVKNGKASCAELESYCQEGYCKPLTCRVLEPIRSLCGCPNGAQPCSICGPGKVISQTEATLNLDPSVAISGFDQSITCGKLNDLCGSGYCNADQCQALPAEVEATCGCKDTTPDFTVFTSGDTTIFTTGSLQGESLGTNDTVLVQGGVANNEDLLPAYALMEFIITDTDYQEIQRLSFATVELCMHHVNSTEPDREMTYTVCVVPSATSGGIENETGNTQSLSAPDSCIDGKFANLTVRPTTGRVCTTVTSMFDDVTGPSTITFMIASEVDSDAPGDRFYSQEDSEGRQPTIQLVDRPFKA